MASSSESSDDENELALALVVGAAAAVLIEAEEKGRKRKRSMWTRDWLLRRPRLGGYSQLLQELIQEDPKETRRFLRMTHENFTDLLQKIEVRIRKQHTHMRKAIEPGERLAITLRFLASGDSFTSLSYMFRVADNTIRLIVLETCAAIYTELKDEYLKVPSAQEEWKKIAMDFDTRWQFPNCIGAIDGKHIQICSPGRGSSYFNYQGFHSIILLALVDAKYKVTWFSVCSNGRAGDAGVFRDSSLADGFEKDILKIPQPAPLPGRTDPVPYFIVGDDAFGLKPYLMKPYPFKSTVVTTGADNDGNEIERRKQQIFDYRLSRARRLSENVFGILTARFGVFQSAICLSPENATSVTLACLALHNFLISKTDQQFAPPSLTDTHDLVHGDWRNNQHNCFLPLQRQAGNRNATDARWVRSEIKEYVNDEGIVPWQQLQVSGRAFS